MADRKDFYYRQQVSEDELDGSFAGLETAEKNIVVDLDFAARDDPDPSAKADYGGIMWGWDMAILGGTEATIATGAGYDEDGNRIATAASLILDVANDGYTAIGAAGLPSGSTTDPGAGNERWVSVLITYDRLLSDARYDGYDNLIYFDRDESFKIHVKAGPTGLIASDPARPAREAGELLLEDLLVTNVAGTISIDSIDSVASTRRKEFFFDYTATNSPYKEIKAKGNFRDVLVAMLEMYSDHVGAVADIHPSADLTWAAGGRTWADAQAGGMGVATNVQDALYGIVDDLRLTQPAGSARSGSASVGVRAQAGALATPASSSLAALVEDDLYTNLQALLVAVNGRIFRGGDDTIGGALTPAANGTDLGASGGNRWDVNARELNVTNVVSNLVPTGTLGLGDATDAWAGLYAEFLSMPRLDSSQYYLDVIAVPNPNNGAIRLQIASAETSGSIVINPRGGVGTAISTGDKAYIQLGTNAADGKGVYIEKELVNASDPDQYRIGFGDVTTPAAPDGLYYRGGGPSTFQNTRGAYLDDTGATYRYAAGITSSKRLPIGEARVTDINLTGVATTPILVEASSTPYEAWWEFPHDTVDDGYRVTWETSDLPYGADITSVSIYWANTWSVSPSTQLRAAFFRSTLVSATPQINRAESYGPLNWNGAGAGVKTYQTWTFGAGEMEDFDPSVDTLQVQIAHAIETGGGTDEIYAVVVTYEYAKADANFPDL